MRVVILDEQLKDLELIQDIKAWYGHSVISISDLRPFAVIPDSEIPVLLRTKPGCTFVTINHTDFWHVIPNDRKYCIVCFSLPTSQRGQIAHLLRQLFLSPPFRTKQSRSGKVCKIVGSQAYFYERPNQKVSVCIELR